MKYSINYYAVIMMQRLGISLEGLAMMLDFLGLVPGVGGTEKWRHLQEAVGVTKQEVSEEVESVLWNPYWIHQPWLLIRPCCSFTYKISHVLDY